MGNSLRLFNKKQKQLLFTLADGVCQICGTILTKEWHGDHIIPFSKNGQTEINNGQALCPKCNIKKSNMNQIKLRDWQDEFHKQPYEKIINKEMKAYLLHAGVGSGKTIGAIVAALEFIKDGYNIIIISPSENVKNEWAKEFNKFGHDIDNKYSFKYNYKTEYRGISITYQSLNYANVGFLISNRIIDNKTLIILDEVHHLGDNKSWGDAVTSLGDIAKGLLLLTGTPTRSDNAKIPFAFYEPEATDTFYKLQVDYSYPYSKSVKENICCPISFRSIGVISEETPDGFLPDTTEGRKFLNLALSINSVNDWVVNAVKIADIQLDQLREMIPDAGGLVVCNSIDDAKKLGERFPDALVVTSDECDSSDIEEFASSDRKWIISVRMVSEGVNIPRLRVIVYATNYNTMLFFQQVAGRALRNRDDEAIGTIDHCFFYYPNYEPLVENAKSIEDEIRHIVEQQEIELKEKIEREYTERQFIDEEMNFETGEENIINGGIELSCFKPFFAGRDIQERNLFERTLAEQIKIHLPISAQPTKLKSDRIKAIKKTIHTIANRIHFKECVPVQQVHTELNNIIGVYSSSELHDESVLNRKLKAAKNRLNGN